MAATSPESPDALSLQGQFGIIGELYGSLDFVIIKASVNVRLEASIGIILALEPPSVPGGGGGSILLYIEASVSVSVTVEINLFLFSISHQLQLQCLVPLRMAARRFVAAGPDARRVARLKQRLLAAAAPNVGLLPGPAEEPADHVPAGADGGIPRRDQQPARRGSSRRSACSMTTIPSQNPTYADFKPFEAVTTQLATFALMHALNLPAYNSVVLLDIRFQQRHTRAEGHRQRAGRC